MSTNKASQVMPSISPMKSVAKGGVPTPQPRQTLDPRPSFTVSNGSQPAFAMDPDMVDDAGNTSDLQ